MEYKNNYFEENEIATLTRIKQADMGIILSWGGDKFQWIKRLMPSTKNKLIDVSEYAIQHQIGNTRLASDILGSLKLEDIYLNSKQRKKLASILRSRLKIIKDEEEGKQCKDLISRHIKFERRLGSGLFGEVYSATLDEFKFAVKFASVTTFGRNPHGVSPEYHIGNLLNELVFNNVAQNLPVMVDSYSCDRCSFESKTIKNRTGRCIISISELGRFDLTEWISRKHNDDFLNSALFQIMAGIHAIQYHYGIVHMDIKPENILVYNVEHGGYWKYTIYGRDFYVPNFGKLFVISDFGLAKIFYPQFKYQHEYKRDEYTSLGDRVFLINNHHFEALNTPYIRSSKIQRYDSFLLNWDDNSSTNVNRVLFNDRTKKVIYNPVLTQPQKDLIGYDSNDLQFYDSNLVPPLEFMIDTQDVLRMFLGGRKMTHRTYHREYRFNQGFISKLKRFELEPELDYDGFLLSKEKKPIELSKMLAGYFILDYFTTEVDYSLPVYATRDWIISHMKTSN